MRWKALHHITFHALALFAAFLTLFGAVLWYDALGYAASSDMPSPPAIAEAAGLSDAAYKKGTGAPARIMIPSIDLDAEIEKVALTSKGSMNVPRDPMNAGWYSLGPHPGERGSAVIDGHVNWFHGATGVFRDLHDVKIGDKITVQDDKGADVVFEVRDIRIYAAAADATDVFSSKDGKAHLNIITCDGVWDKAAGQYSKRLVVFTDKVSL